MLSICCKRFYFIVLVCYLIYTIYPFQVNAWSKISNVSLEGQNASHPQIATDPFGNITSVWYRFDGHHLIIQATTKALEGNWQEIPDNLSLPGQDAFNPQIVIDAFGNIIVVWEQFNGIHSTIQATTKPLGGQWKLLPDQLSLPGQKASNPQIAIDSFGNATAIWQVLCDTHSIIQSSTRPFGDNWQLIPSYLSSPNLNAKNAQIIIDSYETATVVWQASNGLEEIIQTSSRFFQEDWQSVPDTISSIALSHSCPQLRSDSFGNVTVVWNQFNGVYGTIQAATKLYGGTWQSHSDTLSILGHNTFSPQIAINAYGDVTAVWESLGADKLKCIHASTKLFGGKWQICPDTLSIPGDHNVNPQIAIDLSGNTMVVWNNYKGFTRIHVSKRDVGGDWQSTPDLISSPERSAFSPQLTFSSTGKVCIVWIMQDSLSFIQTVNE